MTYMPELCVWDEIAWSDWQQQSVLGKVNLGERQLHIWKVNLQLPPQVAARCLAWLSPEERIQAGEYRFYADTAKYIAAHGLLRFILGGYISEQPADLQFAVNKYGKPELGGKSNQTVKFNLSHSGDRALIAIMDNQQVGVDIEKADNNLEYQDITDMVFSPQEICLLNSVPPEKRLSKFYTIWTGKEAYLKMLGVGLNEEADRQQPSEYALWHFIPEQGYYGAVAVAANVSACRYYRLV